MARSNPGIHSIQVGDATVTALNDGQFEASVDLVLGPSADEVQALLHGGFRVLPPRITVSCFLVEMGGRRVLIDSGCGSAFGPTMGHAGARLASLGIAQGSIDTVLLTHAHPDHVGGLIDEAGKPVFGQAELVLGAIEARYWTDDAAREATPEEHRGDFDLPRRALAAYEGRTRHLADGDTALPGITARLLAGHTPGHTGYRIGEGDRSLLIWADIVHLPGVQFARPDASVGYDSDPEAARVTRARIMAEVAADRQLVAGIHLDFPPFGHVRKAAAGYAFEPVVWAPAT